MYSEKGIRAPSRSRRPGKAEENRSVVQVFNPCRDYKGSRGSMQQDSPLDPVAVVSSKKKARGALQENAIARG